MSGSEIDHMSWSMFAIFIIFAFYLITQFGVKVSAKGALSWWAALLFLGIAIIDPNLFSPITSLLGISVVSNFILAAMILFLLKQTLESAAATTLISRKLRQYVCHAAAESYLKNTSSDFNDKKTSGNSRVLIVIPTFNEEQNLEDMIDKVAKLTRTEGNFEYIVCFIDDGSHDQSGYILRSKAPGQWARHSINLGVAATLLTGFTAAQSLNCDFVVQCDADGQHPVDLIPVLVQQAIRLNADLLIGSRYINARTAKHESTTILRQFGSFILSITIRLFSKSFNVSDPTSGFRVYSQQAVQYLSQHMPDEYPEPESIAILLLSGHRIEEIPISMSARTKGRSSLDGLKSVQYMIKVISGLFSLRLRAFFR